MERYVTSQINISYKVCGSLFLTETNRQTLKGLFKSSLTVGYKSERDGEVRFTVHDGRISHKKFFLGRQIKLDDHEVRRLLNDAPTNLNRSS